MNPHHLALFAAFVSHLYWMYTSRRSDEKLLLLMLLIFSPGLQRMSVHVLRSYPNVGTSSFVSEDACFGCPLLVAVLGSSVSPRGKNPWAIQATLSMSATG